MAKLYDWVMPGDVVLKITPAEKVTIGRGLRQERDQIFATRPGQYLQYGSKHFIVSDEKAYVPRVEDVVVAVVRRGGSFAAGYFMDLGYGAAAKLDSVAFDGASKRNRPDLKPGTAVYCRVVTAQPDIDVELSCCSLLPNRKDWMTGESLFGELKGGTVVRLRPSFCRRLLTPGDNILELIGDRAAFECTVGVNGMLWLRARTSRTGARIVNCLHNIEALLYGGDEDDTATPAQVVDQMLPLAHPPLKRRRLDDDDAEGEAANGTQEEQPEADSDEGADV
eukprot:TRINITY_DN10185_c0_g1_i1.p1 TRINITY_DN10185_c0_g1~~TRINITY_DN10185_c0_g1_i1.p1  ORF type:complete len:300 (+),score=102.88 TRINITY_DN10185_c0_g1_i1:63-902(+)